MSTEVVPHAGGNAGAVQPVTTSAPAVARPTAGAAAAAPRAAARTTAPQTVDAALAASTQAVFQSLEQHLTRARIGDVARVMDAVSSWYGDFAGFDYDQRDTLDKEACKRVLQEAWGPDYATNVELLRGMLGRLPAESADLLGSARGPDGKAIFNDAPVIELFVNAERALMTGYIHDHRSPGVVSDIERQIAEIENVMRTDRKRYNRDEGMQARYRALLNSRG